MRSIKMKRSRGRREIKTDEDVVKVKRQSFTDTFSVTCDNLRVAVTGARL